MCCCRRLCCGTAAALCLLHAVCCVPGSGPPKAGLAARSANSRQTATTAAHSRACSHRKPPKTRSPTSHRSPRHPALHHAVCDTQLSTSDRRLCTVQHATVIMEHGAQDALHGTELSTPFNMRGRRKARPNSKQSSSQRWHCSLRLCCRRRCLRSGGT